MHIEQTFLGCAPVGLLEKSRDDTPCELNNQNWFRGYAKIRINGKNELLHRVVYCEHKGISIESIRGLVVRHRCDNPRCINPDHLEIGTQLDNVKDMEVRHRARKAFGEKNHNSKLTDDVARKIRSEYIKGSSTQGTYALAEKYGVSQRAIFLCVNGKTWRHI